ncbi:MAG: NAD-dependent epimerase/dehydratase family protein [Jiangellaceae bacterium]
MRALVTGGAGFIGSHLVDALVDEGADVVVLDDLSTGRADNVSPAADLVDGSVVDQNALDEAIHRCDVVFHQAAIPSVPRSVQRPIETDRANTGGTLGVLVAAHRADVRRVVIASSSSVYGGEHEGPTHETVMLTPHSPYAVSKLNGEHYARVFAELYDLDTVALRYFNVFGPRQAADSAYAAVIPRFADALLKGDAPVVFGDGLQSRDFTFVSDAVQANLRAARASAAVCAGRAFNVARGETHTLLELIEILQQCLGVDIAPQHLDARPGDVRHSHADISAAREKLGYRPRVSFADGLAQTLTWFRASANAGAAPVRGDGSP